MARPRKYESAEDRQRAYRNRKKEALRNVEALRYDKPFTKVDRPVLRYYGGKWRIGEWIIKTFPPHNCYVEPFGGAGSVLLQKNPAPHEVLNDLNGDVINFFRVLRTSTEDLVRAIWLTPYSREELTLARSPAAIDDPIERARRFYVRCWQSFGSGVGRTSTGWRYAKGDNNSDSSPIPVWNNTQALWQTAERLKMVQIECDDALAVIKRFDTAGTLFYVDPPYVHSTRYNNSSSKGYLFEMDDADHIKLSDLLHSVQGMVIVSGYPSELYERLYAGWKQQSRSSLDVNGKAQTETIWLSPKTIELNSLPLFATGAFI